MQAVQLFTNLRSRKNLDVVGAAGIEPATTGLEIRCSIRLSYAPSLFAKCCRHPQNSVSEIVEGMLSSFMSLYKRGKVWWSRIEIAGQIHQFSTRCHQKNEATSVEAAKRTELIKGIVGLAAPTLLEFSEQLINTLQSRVKKPTFGFYECHLKPLLDFPALCDCRLDKIDAVTIDAFVQWRRKHKGIKQGETVATATINHSLRTLRRALGVALEFGLIAKIPQVKLLTGENQRDFIITPEAEQQFIAEGSGHKMSFLVPFLCDTGLRRSELSNLQWKDVNLKERYISITHGKTKHARRKIPLTKRAEKILLELKEKAPNSPYVFLHPGIGRMDAELVRCSRMTNDWLSHAFLHARKRLKLPETAVLHSTRHTFCTRLGERGADAFAIQRLAGHSSIIISQRYVHPSAARLDAAIALLE
jgi:integrase